MKNTNLTVMFTDIIYDLDGFGGFDSYDTDRTREEILCDLPTTHYLNISGASASDVSTLKNNHIALVEDEIEERYGWTVQSCSVHLHQGMDQPSVELKYEQPPLEDNGITRSILDEFAKTHDIWNDSSNEVKEFVSQLNYTQRGYLSHIRLWNQDPVVI